MDAVPETTPVGDLRVALGGFADIHFLRGFVNSVFFTLFVQTWDAHGYRNAVEYLKQPKYRGFLLGWLLFNLFCSFGLFFVDSATIVSLVNPFHATVIGPAYFGYILWRCRREGCSYRESFRIIGVSVLQCIVIFPIVSVLLACCFLVIDSIVLFLHFPDSFLNWPIYYGVLYGPFSATYILTMREIRARRERGILPS
eukprot:GEMP01106152.1.p1 GENE.GEMP01106152.1~~GEMP01106152.1.p1  ORF type:complete len:198 (+),score=21.27 GEMP01106152.1:135-728(+)